jgi:hypothetical protein
MYSIAKYREKEIIIHTCKLKIILIGRFFYIRVKRCYQYNISYDTTFN